MCIRDRENTYVVNSFKGGAVIDYGNYSSVKMLNTCDPIKQDRDAITFSSSAKKAYYQGNLDNAEIPWNISLRYYLDGEEYSADEIAGKSGALEIRFKITENTSCSGTFYDDYALQASFTLDTEQCGNISAPGATLANVGSKKQINYTILPGRGIDTAISADVTNLDVYKRQTSERLCVRLPFPLRRARCGCRRSSPLEMSETSARIILRKGCAARDFQLNFSGFCGGDFTGQTARHFVRRYIRPAGMPQLYRLKKA